MHAHKIELENFAGYLRDREASILQSWEAAVKADAHLAVGDSLRRTDLIDHIPALLTTFAMALREYHPGHPSRSVREFHRDAAAHGLKRWQQGYDLIELVRELAKLNECVVQEIDRYTLENARVPHSAVTIVRGLWAAFSGVSVEESVRQYYHLQQQEAGGQMRDLETALDELRALETQRGDLWREAAHDLRGNLGVVANASVGLTHSGLGEASRDGFVRILIRNVSSLHRLLDDVTSLARLQAGREERRIESIDVTPILQELAEGIRAAAEQKGLYLRCEGPAGFATEGDAVKVRRVAQNLILNAVKFTTTGGITVTWGDSGADDSKHWELRVSDTGPGFPSHSGQAMAQALERTAPDRTGVEQTPQPFEAHTVAFAPGAGEGLGLSIVKRLCEMLDATLERSSAAGVGTSFRVLFPRRYLKNPTA